MEMASRCVLIEIRKLENKIVACESNSYKKVSLAKSRISFISAFLLKNDSNHRRGIFVDFRESAKNHVESKMVNLPTI